MESRIGLIRKFLYRWRWPNIFEVITFLFMFLYWTAFFLKLIFQGLYQSIDPKGTTYLNLLGLETFQYSILFIDYVVAWSLSAVLICYINIWLEPVNFIMKYFINFSKKFLFPLFILILCSTLIGGIYISAVFGSYLYNYQDFTFTWLISFLLITRGTMVRSFSHAYMVEDYEYVINRVNMIMLLI